MFPNTPNRLRRCVTRFGRHEDGNLAVETMIIIPVLFWAFLAMLVMFDAYRQHSINQKAAYTIGDLISRQTDDIDPAFLGGTKDLFDVLTRSASETSVRVTAVSFDAAENEYVLEWSEALGAQVGATADEVVGWASRLPVMPDAEWITVVETWSAYEAPFNIGITDHEIRNFVFTRPRNSPEIGWDPVSDIPAS